MFCYQMCSVSIIDGADYKLIVDVCTVPVRFFKLYTWCSLLAEKEVFVLIFATGDIFI